MDAEILPEKTYFPSRERNASLLSKSVFQWISPLIKVGYGKPLERNDLWAVNPKRRVEQHAHQLSYAFRRCRARGDRHSLLWALHDVFKFEFWLEGAATLLANVFQIMSPFILRYLLSFITQAKGQGSDNAEGFLLCILLFLSQNIMSFGIHHWTFTGEVLGSEVKAALMKLIFDQSLHIGRAPNVRSPSVNSGYDTSTWTEGKVVNLISTDASRVDECLRYGHLIWTGPIMVVFCLALLFFNLGLSILPGLALLLVATEGVKRVINFTIKKRLSLNEALDRRVEASKEAMQIIQLIKYYAWEGTFLRRILGIRAEELKHLRTYEIVSNGTFAVSTSIPLYCMVLTFSIFSLTGHVLQPAQVFASLALFNCLRMPLAMVPMLIGQIPNAMISLNRIQRFLELERSETVVLDSDMIEAVAFDQATLRWILSKDHLSDQDLHLKDTSTEETLLLSNAESTTSSPPRLLESFSLNQINLKFGRSEFIAVTGGVASGKSSLLSALCGEMTLEAGRVKVGGSIAHCGQSPWIMSGTVKQNILFGKQFRLDKFDRVIEACALQEDLDAMPYGSETAIGERGITLSGGQKQRLALARALYSDCPILLLDDPFSAVDAKVAKHIFNKVLCSSLLDGRCKIVATHQLELLPKADCIIWMENGEVRECDGFNVLRRLHPDFENIVQNFGSEAKDPSTSSSETKRVMREDKATGNGNSALVQDEHREVGTVSAKIYKVYTMAAGGFLWQTFFLIMLCFAQGMSLLTGLILAWWTSDRLGLSKGMYVCLYAVCGVVQYAIVFAFYTLGTINGLRASKHLLQAAITRIVQAPMSFFNVTPIGRLLSLFTRDVDIIDCTTGSAIIVFLNSLAVVFSTIIFTSVLLPWVIPVIFLLVLGCFYSGGYYRRTARELKRHESVLRSICMAQVTEAITGSATIRGYQAENEFSNRLNSAINEMSGSTHLVAATRQWLGVRLDAVGNLLVLSIAVLTVLQRQELDPSLSGLVMTYALAVVNQLAYLVSNAGDVEDSMVPVERMVHYSNVIPQEVEAKQETDTGDPNWPQCGKVVARDLSVHYHPRHPSALSNVTLTILPGSITSLIGRTGSGKSTLLASIFRMTPTPSSGAILIDGVDISNVPLSKLRSSIAIVPQDPACWRGTIRDNVDPTHSLSETHIENMLRKCTLMTSSLNYKNTLNLDSQVDSSGLNLSFGQRQLLSLARALLRNTSLLILDEATSGLDTQTNNTILDIVKREVKERLLTVIFVAHRMRSVMYLGGRVVVLENGRVVEEGDMEQLWRKGDQDGGVAWFRGLCQAAGVNPDTEVSHDTIAVKAAARSLSGKN